MSATMASLNDCQPHQTSVEMIRAAEDAPRNLLTGMPRSAQYAGILSVRRSLPVAQPEHQARFLENLHNHQVSIFVSETGTGRTTQLPQLAMFDCIPGELQRNKMKIACTQPRQSSAKSVAERVAHELDVKIGAEVGYAYRGCDRTSDRTILQFMTDGLLLAEAANDPRFLAYSCIILDEAHERSIATDILMGYLKVAIQSNPNLKIVILSATLMSNMFSDYFPGAVTQHVEESTFNVDVFYLIDPPSNIIMSAVDTVMQIHLTKSDGDILVFTSGVFEINRIKDAIESEMKKYDQQWIGELVCYELHAKTSRKEQDDVVHDLAPMPKGPGRYGRKVIIATNFAETSLTMDGVVYVVDTCTQKDSVYNPRTDITYFGEVSISKAQAKQRKGRAGRTRPGECYRMCTETAFHMDLAAQTVPPILKADLTSEVFRLIYDEVNPLDFEFLQPPAPETISRALGELWNLDLITIDCTLTHLGKRASHLHLDPYKAKLLVESVNHGCTDEIISILAMLNAVDGRSIWSKPESEKRKTRLDAAKKFFCHDRGDHLTLLKVYRHWDRQVKKRSFCYNNVLDIEVLRQADQIRTRLLDVMKRSMQIKPLPTSDPEYIPKILRALCSGYFMRSAMMIRPKVYQTTSGKRKVKLGRGGSMRGKPQDLTWVIYDECRQAQDGATLQTVTAVLPEWLIRANSSFWVDESFPEGPMKKTIVETMFDLTGIPHAILRDDDSLLTK